MMNKRTGVCVLLGLSLGISPGLQADNLVQVFETARKNDPTYGAAVAQYKAAIEASPKAWASVLPQINLSGSYVDTERETTSVNNPAFSSQLGTQDFTSETYSLTLSQTLYNKAQFDAIDQADALVLQAEANYQDALHDLIVRVAETYFNVLSEKANLIFAQAEKKAIAQQLNQAKQRFNVGLTAITDVHEAQARYDLAVSQAIEAQRLYDISIENLREITGQEHADLAALKTDETFTRPTPDDINNWVNIAIENNLQLKAAKSAVDAAREAKDIAYAGHYPTVTLGAEYRDSEDENPSFGTTSDSTILSLQLNLPLYAGGGTNAAGREASANYMRSKELAEQQRRATVREARNSYLTVISALSQVSALKQSLVSTQTALEATQAGFEVGTRTTVDVLDSQREVYRAQRDYIRARHAYIVNLLRLKRAGGILGEQDLQLINAWLK